MVFPVIMYECESWTIGKAVSWRTDALELWCWEDRVPWTARTSNKSILKEINPEHLLEGLMLKNFGHLMGWANSLEKTLTLAKIEGKRTMGWQRIRWLDSITASIDMNLRKVWEMLEDRVAWCAAVHLVMKSRTRLSYWVATNFYWSILYNSQDMEPILVSKKCETHTHMHTQWNIP